MSGFSVLWFIVGFCFAFSVYLIVVHVKQRRQGRLPGQRWDRQLKRWVDME